MAYSYPTEHKDIEFFNYLEKEWKQTNFLLRLFLWPAFLIYASGENDYKRAILKRVSFYTLTLTLIWIVAAIYFTSLAIATISAFYGIPLELTIISFFGVIGIYLFVLAFNNAINLIAMFVCIVKAILYSFKKSKE